MKAPNVHICVGVTIYLMPQFVVTHNIKYIPINRLLLKTADNIYDFLV